MINGLEVALDQVVQLGTIGRGLLTVLFELKQQLGQKHGVLHLALLKALGHGLVFVNLAIKHHGDLVKLQCSQVWRVNLPFH